MNEIILTTKEELYACITDAVLSAMSKTSSTSINVSKPHIKGIHQLAKFLGISASKAQRLKNEKIIPYFQNERLVLFDPDKVRDAMANYNKRRMN